MIDSTVREQAANRLRRAVTREAYDEVQTAISDYRREVEAVLAGWQPDEPPPVEVVREALDLTEWALRVVRVARSRTSDKLDQVSAVLRYQPAHPRRPTWKLEG